MMLTSLFCPVNGNQPGYTECSASFNPLLPTGCSHVLSVGATALDWTLQESPTNSGQFWSGAGFSNYFGTPSYQAKDVKAYLSSIGNLDQGKYNKDGVRIYSFCYIVVTVAAY